MPDRSPAVLSTTAQLSTPPKPFIDLDTPLPSATAVLPSASASLTDSSRAPANPPAMPLTEGSLDRSSEPTQSSARQAYLDARAQAGAVGIALADPAMRRALILDGLQREHARQAETLPGSFDVTHRPAPWRPDQRAQWQRHRSTLRSLQRNAAWQEELCGELGPEAPQLVSRARALAAVREQILAKSPQLQRNAVEEEIAREPQWLSDTLGPRPERDTDRWQALAEQMAANRLRFMVCDDTDPGIRPEQSQLAQQVAHFHGAVRLAHTLGAASAIGLGI